MGYNEAVNYLYGLQKHGIKLGLDNIKKLLSFFDNPQGCFRSVHIAGTNGKGSTSAMTASVLQAAGLKAGLFTSPHLVSFTERIRINNEEITEQEVVELTDEIREAVLKVKDFSPTFFEVVTAIGFLYFKRKNVDWAVVETGLGGRLDATNVLVPEVSVITGIGYDHREFLGNTISEIAGEKAGIIKDKVSVVVSVQEPAVMSIIEKKAAEKDSKVFLYGREFSSIVKRGDEYGSVFDYKGDGSFHDLKIPLSGKHQVLNASLALKALEILAGKSAIDSSRLSAGAIREGLEGIKWHGRLEFVSDNPPILIDGAHNPSASNALADSLKNIFLKKYRRIILIMGIMADKDINGIMAPLLPLASEIIAASPAYERSASPKVLSEHARSLGFFCMTAGSIKEALSAANRLWKDGDMIVVTGSFYTIGEAKEALGEKGVLSRLRE